MAIKASEINQLIDRVNALVKFARGVGQVKNNPPINPGGGGPGLSWECYHYGGQLRNSIPEEMKQDKYQGDNIANTYINTNTHITAENLNNISNIISEAINVVKHETSGWDQGDVNLNNSERVNKNTLIRLQQLQSAVNAINTIDNTLSRVNGWFNSNNKCNRSCQVNCQVGCQVACNNVNWCHDQKCGGH